MQLYIVEKTEIIAHRSAGPIYVKRNIKEDKK
jgi:hypothetical protein